MSSGCPEPPKSSCIGCPFHSDEYWREMRDHRPEEWAQAVEMDHHVRKPIERPGNHVRAEQYMHNTRVPLDKVDLSTPEDHGQLNMFIHDCEGMCGV